MKNKILTLTIVARKNFSELNIELFTLEATEHAANVTS